MGWLADNRLRIEAYYNSGDTDMQQEDASHRDLADLVAVVAPFTAQCSRVRTLLRDRLARDLGDPERAKSIVDRMKLGTVHSLQGAERPLVLFTATNTPGDGGAPFMDAATDMLNVAVSRAKDTFILFGHPGLFFDAGATQADGAAPSGVLGAYLRKYGERLYPRRLVVVESPHKVTDIQRVLGRDCLVVETRGHFRTIAALSPGTATPTWRVLDDAEGVAERLANEVQNIDELVIATDDDREGDAIGWHVVDELQARVPTDGLRVSRMVFDEITDGAITRGFESRYPWRETSRARAAIARAIIDRAIGQAATAVARARVPGWRGGVGRVRAALLHMIAERDRTIDGTEPTWVVEATLQGPRGDISACLVDGAELTSVAKHFTTREEAQNAADALGRADGLRGVARVQAFTLGPAQPVGTADVLIAAYSQLGLAPHDTAKILQALYGGSRRAVAGADADRSGRDG